MQNLIPAFLNPSTDVFILNFIVLKHINSHQCFLTHPSTLTNKLFYQLLFTHPKYLKAKWCRERGVELWLLAKPELFFPSESNYNILQGGLCKFVCFCYSSQFIIIMIRIFLLSNMGNAVYFLSLSVAW